MPLETSDTITITAIIDELIYSNMIGVVLANKISAGTSAKHNISQNPNIKFLK